MAHHFISSIFHVSVFQEVSPQEFLPPQPHAWPIIQPTISEQHWHRPTTLHGTKNQNVNIILTAVKTPNLTKLGKLHNLKMKLLNSFWYSTQFRIGTNNIGEFCTYFDYHTTNVTLFYFLTHVSFDHISHLSLFSVTTVSNKN
jgi:hypothetical protein